MASTAIAPAGPRPWPAPMLPNAAEAQPNGETGPFTTDSTDEHGWELKRKDISVIYGRIELPGIVFKPEALPRRHSGRSSVPSAQSAVEFRSVLTADSSDGSTADTKPSKTANDIGRRRTECRAGAWPARRSLRRRLGRRATIRSRNGPPASPSTRCFLARQRSTLWQPRTGMIRTDR